MGNVTPGDMRAIIQSQENGAPGGGLACIDLLNRMWDCRTKRRISAKQVNRVRVCIRVHARACTHADAHTHALSLIEWPG